MGEEAPDVEWPNGKPNFWQANRTWIGTLGAMVLIAAVCLLAGVGW